jgi:molecular chaperone GrpE
VTVPHHDPRRDGDPDEPREQSERPVIRDRRRIDPTTGEVRASPAAGRPEPAAGATPEPTDPLDRLEAELAADLAGAEGLTAELDRARAEATERLDDLRRLQAEYVNYRRRVERDREVAGDLALVRALTELLPVLDDIGRARDHGDLTGGFKSVADSLEAAVGRLGLQRFGAVGDPFDPAVHEALMHAHADPVEVTGDDPAGAAIPAGPVCDQILLPGYRVGDRILRPARVSVLEPPE